MGPLGAEQQASILCCLLLKNRVVGIREPDAAHRAAPAAILWTATDQISLWSFPRTQFSRQLGFLVKDTEMKTAKKGEKP